MDEKLILDKVYSWIITFGPRILMAIVIFFVGLWIIRLAKRWLNRSFLKHNINSSFRPFLASLIATMLQVFLVIAILQILGIRMTIFAALVGAIGVAVGLALSGTMQNFASGILILILKPFEQNDTIIAQGHTGIVSSIQIFYTVILTDDNRTVIIPNSKLSNEVITNLSRQGKRRIDIELKLNYGFDLAKIEPVIRNAFLSSPVILDEPAPRVEISAMETDGYKIIMNGWVQAENYDLNKSDVQKEILAQLKAAGFKLPGMT